MSVALTVIFVVPFAYACVEHAITQRHARRTVELAPVVEHTIEYTPITVGTLDTGDTLLLTVPPSTDPAAAATMLDYLRDKIGRKVHAVTANGVVIVKPPEVPS